MFRPDDHRWMARALALAERGRPRAHPNPLVGGVVVRGSRCVGEGAHARFGGPHAEASALAQAGRLAQGATLYVTLEPCHRWGKTPPCSAAIHRAGIRRVVVAASDPSMKGAGVTSLRRAGVLVETGLLSVEARRQNPGFHRRLQSGRPHLVLKIAETLDGKIASSSGRSRWITGPRARALGHSLRAQSDAILVGGETLRRDDPALTSHGRGPDPLRVILSRSLTLSSTLRVFHGGPSPWILTSDKTAPARRRRWERRGIPVIAVAERKGRIDLAEGLKALARRGVGQLLVEGGGRTAAAFLEAGLVDEIYCFIALRFLGGAEAITSVEGRGWSSPAQGPRLRDVGVTRLGDDLLVHGHL